MTFKLLLHLHFFIIILFDNYSLTTSSKNIYVFMRIVSLSGLEGNGSKECHVYTPFVLLYEGLQHQPQRWHRKQQRQ